MEGQRVDRVDDVAATVFLRRGLPVALEGVLARLGLGGVFEPFHGDAAFDGGGRVAGVVGHAGYGAGEEFEGGFALLPGLGWGGLLGEGGEEGWEVVDVHEAGGHGDYDFGGAGGEGVGLAGEGDGQGWLGGGGGVVDVEGVVPGGGDEEGWREGRG